MVRTGYNLVEAGSVLKVGVGVVLEGYSRLKHANCLSVAASQVEAHSLDLFSLVLNYSQVLNSLGSLQALQPLEIVVTLGQNGL